MKVAFHGLSANQYDLFQNQKLSFHTLILKWVISVTHIKAQILFTPDWRKNEPISLAKNIRAMLTKTRREEKKEAPSIDMFFCMGQKNKKNICLKAWTIQANHIRKAKQIITSLINQLINKWFYFERSKFQTEKHRSKRKGGFDPCWPLQNK